MPSVARGTSVSQQASVIYSDGTHLNGVLVKGPSVTNGATKVTLELTDDTGSTILTDDRARRASR